MIVAAPFFGEFGWEVALWAPWLRWCKADLPMEKMTVICRPGHEGLYTDFADKILVKEIATSKIDCNNAWVDGVRLRMPDYHRIAGDVTGESRIIQRNLRAPPNLPYVWTNGPPCPSRQHLPHNYANGNQRGEVIVLHARACKDKQPDRNWSPLRWEILAEHLDAPLVSIGTVRDALHVPGSEDLRGQSVADDIEILSEARLCIGPSSGPLHLANHCGVPVVWWSSHLKEVERYKTAWNPFNLKNLCAARSWNPQVEEVLKCVASS